MSRRLRNISDSKPSVNKKSRSQSSLSSNSRTNFSSELIRRGSGLAANLSFKKALAQAATSRAPRVSKRAMETMIKTSMTPMMTFEIF